MASEIIAARSVHNLMRIGAPRGRVMSQRCADPACSVGRSGDNMRGAVNLLNRGRAKCGISRSDHAAERRPAISCRAVIAWERNVQRGLGDKGLWGVATEDFVYAAFLRKRSIWAVAIGFALATSSSNR
jgi:hypothetical protein